MVDPSRGNTVRTWMIRVGLFALLVALLWWALKDVPLGEILETAARLRPWHLIVILLVNSLYYFFTTLRWWLIVTASHRQVSFKHLIVVRLAVFGVSYFTPGPQVGGEPLQVLRLRQRYGVPFTRATATVILDKLLEFLVNFLLIAAGLFAILQAGILFGNAMRMGSAIAGIALLISWPPIHITLLFKRRYPLSWVIRATRVSPKHKFYRFVRAAEHLAGAFIQRYPGRLFSALLSSLLSGGLLVLDYTLITRFLGINLSLWNTFTCWAMGWLSLLMPLPGGLGALEASQVFALGQFGYSAATALGLTLLMRGRDIFIGSIGLLLAVLENTRDNKMLTKR